MGLLFQIFRATVLPCYLFLFVNFFICIISSSYINTYIPSLEVVMLSLSLRYHRPWLSWCRIISVCLIRNFCFSVCQLFFTEKINRLHNFFISGSLHVQNLFMYVRLLYVCICWQENDFVVVIYCHRPKWERIVQKSYCRVFILLSLIVIVLCSCWKFSWHNFCNIYISLIGKPREKIIGYVAHHR